MEPPNKDSWIFGSTEKLLRHSSPYQRNTFHFCRDIRVYPYAKWQHMNWVEVKLYKLWGGKKRLLSLFEKNKVFFAKLALTLNMIFG